MDNSSTGRGIGLPVAMPEESILIAAGLARDRGFTSFWLNNPPGSQALPVLGTVARSVPDMRLGVGVVPLSAYDPATIASAARASDIEPMRLNLGIGSGAGAQGLTRVRDGLSALRELWSGPIAVAALGPRMCRLAGAQADVVLLNWLTPEFARTSIGWVQSGAREAQRPTPRIVAYVRAAVEAGVERLRGEAATYESYPQYAAHFERMGTPAIDTTVFGDNRQIQEELAAWDGVVDEVVVRAVPSDDSEAAVRRVLEAVAPG